ncbi:hypothetical protein C8R47DRAFT_1068552 [Mycena vitilis]|nr:hypothetical protein C8R47DRAFT_1068544 [Mycena vitilis]KAJ6499637.1 hypothetical protein C8R47DRAFT_1068552 [Mycena vitilis]
MLVVNIAVGRCAVPVLVLRWVPYPVSNSIHPPSPRLELVIHLRLSCSAAVSMSYSNCVCASIYFKDITTCICAQNALRDFLIRTEDLPPLAQFGSAAFPFPTTTALLLMDNTFTFTFQFPSNLLTSGTPTRTLTAHPPANSPSSPITTTGSGQASPPTIRTSYRIRDLETEESLRKLKNTKKITSDNLQGLSSAELRASKTFAAFRDYVRQFMFWVEVDDDDPAEVAAYERFLRRNTPNLSREMSDDDCEYLFRHVTPEPETNSMHFLAPPLSITANSPRNAAAPQPASLDLLLGERKAQGRDGGLIALYSGDCDVALNLKRIRARERMAKRRAAIKALPLHVQQELTERARASRARYREQQSPYTVDEYIQLRRVRESRPSHRNYLRPVQPYHPDSPSHPPGPLFF